MYSINTKSKSAAIEARRQELEARIQRGLQLRFESEMAVAETNQIKMEAEAMIARVKARKRAEEYFGSAKTRPESRAY